MKVVEVKNLHTIRKCDMCGKKLRVAFITNDEKYLCKECAEKVDYPNARKLYAEYRHNRHLNERLDKDRNILYLYKHYLKDDENVKEVIERCEERLKNRKVMLAKDKVTLLRYATEYLPREKLLHINSCAYMYRLVHDILKGMVSFRKVKYEGTSFYAKWTRLLNTGVCDMDWIKGFILENEDELIQICPIEDAVELIAVIHKYKRGGIVG